MTVGEIAARVPASTRVFEEYRIDFCCNGGTPLADACAALGLEPARLLGEIERAAAGAAQETPEIDWSRAPLDMLADHIVVIHHGYLNASLPRLAAMLEKIVEKHSERHGDVLAPLAATFGGLRLELESHLAKEENILFPLIRALDSGDSGVAFHCGSVRNPIRVMLMEHDSAGEALARMRSLTGGYAVPEDACNTFRAFYNGLAELELDLHRHIHLENNILFPRAVELEACAR
jgi:regulator of cell morphogenesis and NO signaling